MKTAKKFILDFLGTDIYLGEKDGRPIYASDLMEKYAEQSKPKFPTDEEIKKGANKYSNKFSTCGGSWTDKNMIEFATNDFIAGINWLKSKLQ